MLESRSEQGASCAPSRQRGSRARSCCRSTWPPSCMTARLTRGTTSRSSSGSRPSPPRRLLLTITRTRTRTLTCTLTFHLSPLTSHPHPHPYTVILTLTPSSSPSPLPSSRALTLHPSPTPSPSPSFLALHPHLHPRPHLSPLTHRSPTPTPTPTSPPKGACGLVRLDAKSTAPLRDGPPPSGCGPALVRGRSRLWCRYAGRAVGRTPHTASAMAAHRRARLPPNGRAILRCLRLLRAQQTARLVALRLESVLSSPHSTLS